MDLIIRGILYICQLLLNCPLVRVKVKKLKMSDSKTRLRLKQSTLLLDVGDELEQQAYQNILFGKNLVELLQLRGC